MAFADDFVALFEPWLTPDLDDYLRAIAEPFTEVADIVLDTDDHEGWTALFDPDRCPEQFLPHLAQYVGERLPVGIPEALAREWIKDQPNRRRGTNQAIAYAAQRSMTGLRTVLLSERYLGEVDHALVVTYQHETPDPVQVRRDIESVIPADTVLTYENRVGQSYGDADNAPNTTYNDWLANYTSYDDVLTTIPANAEGFQRVEP